MITRVRWCTAALIALLPATALAAALTGKLVTTGSDTLGELSSLWAEELKRRNPQISVQVRAIGSGAAPTALTEGTADIGPMSRPMSAGELRSFRRRFGYRATAIPVAVDELAVFVHRDNPISSISVPQLDAVFSATRRCGYPRILRRWSDLGVPGRWSDGRIGVYGRTAASGTYSFFRRELLCGGDFRGEANRLVGSAAVVRAVSRDPLGIGYASAGYLNSGIKRLRVSPDSTDSADTAALVRRLFLYINLPPGTVPEPVVAAYLSIALGPTGQREVQRAGYLPLPQEERARLRRSLGLDPQ